MTNRILERLEERVIEALGIDKSRFVMDEGEYSSYCSLSLCEVKEIVQEVAKDGDWILCSDRLPQEDEPETALCEIVNITLKNGAVTVGWCNRYIGKWFALDEHCDCPIPYKYEDVTAWQPLPAPYQKGELNE